MKVRSCHVKKASYSFTKNKAEKNKTEVKTDLDALKASISVTSTGPRKVGASAQDIDVLNATNDVVNQLGQYSTQLSTSIAKVEVLRKEIESTLCG
jgi:hypothetical protein